MKINLLKKYPKSSRNINKRNQLKSKKIQLVSRRFGKEYFDGKREFGYGGYYYNKKFWSNVVKDFKKFYKLNNNSKILDIGCGKGFMIFDFKKILPKAKIVGIDISKHAIKNSHPEIKKNLKVFSAKKKLPFKNNQFDIAISFGLFHNFSIFELEKSIKEFSRVAKKNYLMVYLYF